MARLSWNQDLIRRYEFGVDRGVFYPEEGLAVPWDGLVSITEIPVDGSAEPYFFDGINYLNKPASFDYQFNLTAFSAPKDFFKTLGERPIIPGFILTNQPLMSFGLSYRTTIGDDIGYKIHLIYNALAKSSDRASLTINKSGDIQPRSWSISTTPIDYPGFKPTSHIIFDTTKMLPGTQTFLEEIIYGTEQTAPRMPTFDELSMIFESWEPIVIEYNDSGLSTLVPGVGDLISTKKAGLLVLMQTTRLGLTPDPYIYRLES